MLQDDDGAFGPEKDNPERQTTTLAEDVLLVLFQPASGAFVGEGTLYYVLAGAVLADLGLSGSVKVNPEQAEFTTVTRVADRPPQDDLLTATWDYLGRKPRGVQTVLAAMGPTLREPVVARLVARGEIGEKRRKILGFIPTLSLELRGTRRSELVDALRAVLVDGAEPDPRIAALAALIYGSGSLPELGADIPWTADVIARGERLASGEWSAGAASLAVLRTLTSAVISGVVAARNR